MYYTKKIHKYIIFTVLLTVLAIEIPIIVTGYKTQPSASDTIIILGAKLINGNPSIILQLRLDEAIKLYHDNYASTIIVSGGQGKDETMSEAMGMQHYLINHGIAAENIIVEDHSVNTYQNLTNSQGIMQAKGFKTAIIVSNSSHMRRSLALAEHLGIQASGASAPMSNNIFLTVGQYLREGAAMALLPFRQQ